jgi:hypothetical protein
MAGQTRKQIIQLGKLDLQAAFPGAGAGSENIEDQLGAIDDFRIEQLFKIALLRGAEIEIDNNKIRPDRLRKRFDLVNFAAAEERGRIRFVTRLRNGREHLSSSRSRKFFKLRKELLRMADVRSGPNFKADQDSAFRG